MYIENNQFTINVSTWSESQKLESKRLELHTLVELIHIVA